MLSDTVLPIPINEEIWRDFIQEGEVKELKELFKALNERHEEPDTQYKGAVYKRLGVTESIGYLYEKRVIQSEMGGIESVKKVVKI